MLRSSRQNWHEIFEAFDDVEPHADRASGSASHGYQLKIRSITGYQQLLFRAPFKNGYNYAGGFWGLKITDPGVKIKGVGYRLSLNSISLEEADGGSEGVPNAYSLTYQIRVSFYDTVHGQFFGETWKSQPISSKDGSQQMSELSCNKVLYFHTPIADSNVVLVVEVVVYQEPKNPLPGEESVVTTKTFGWGVIRPFKQEVPLKDVSNEDALTVRKYAVDT